ncbi:MAG: Cof-type HAD-IIB family hydrolase [Oscillospiraceae bacterium]|nr:Cof-type HAD-IIB family hydrolase [Oscillospiraceae bacterium]
MKKFENVLLVTDVDGTLIDDNAEIGADNLAAIEYFRQQGGIFTIATGRGQQMAQCIIDELPTDVPAVIFNGAAVYDYVKDDFVWQSSLQTVGAKYLRDFLDEFPDVCAEYLCGKDVYVVRKNGLEEEHLRLGNIKPIICELEDIPIEQGLKALIIAEPHIIEKAYTGIKDRHYDTVNWVRSAPQYLELLPKGTSKGDGMLKLIELRDLSDYTIVAAGDYLNDLEMVEYADIGFATSNAHPDLIAVADYVCNDNNHAAIADIIDKLDRGDIELHKGKGEKGAVIL